MKESTTKAGTKTNDSVRQYLILLSIYVLLVVGYVGMRFAWRWSPGDSGRLTWTSQTLYEEQTITPSSGAYEHGYAYSTLNVFIAHVAGVSVETLQTFVQPFLVVILVPLSYVFFRSLTSDRSIAMLASLLLFLQPEFLFESVRSSHAKITWILAMNMLFVLLRSFKAPASSWLLASWVMLFYLTTFGLITSNAFFASSYVFGLAFAFLGGQILTRFRNRRYEVPSQLERLLYITLSCSILFFLFFFHIYRPALQSLKTLHSLLDRVAALFLNTENMTNPYSYIKATWVSTEVYIILTLFSWLVLALSFVAWILKGRELFLRRERASTPTLLLWLLYGAFAFLLAVSVLLDVAGALSANMQARLFPHLMVVAMPLASESIVRFIRWLSDRAALTHWAAIALLFVCVLGFAGTALIKMTNEPLLSNQWSFHSVEEKHAVKWVGKHVYQARVWTGFGERLAGLTNASEHWQKHGLEADRDRQFLHSEYFVVSDISHKRSVRLRIPLPNVRPHLKIYDNGAVSLYHTRSQTAHQP